MTERIWTGPTPRKNDKKLRAAIFLGQDGKCKCCGQKLNLSEWDLDHEVELADGGSNDESNLVAKCKKCHRAKTSQSQAVRAKGKRTRDKFTGAWKSKSRPMAGNRNSPFKKKLSGEVERR